MLAILKASNSCGILGKELFLAIGGLFRWPIKMTSDLIAERLIAGVEGWKHTLSLVDKSVRQSHP